VYNTVYNEKIDIGTGTDKKSILDDDLHEDTYNL